MLPTQITREILKDFLKPGNRFTKRQIYDEVDNRGGSIRVGPNFFISDHLNVELNKGTLLFDARTGEFVVPRGKGDMTKKIIIEGGDFAGKDTIVDMLKSEYRIKEIKFPYEETFIGKHIRHLLNIGGDRLNNDSAYQDLIQSLYSINLNEVERLGIADDDSYDFIVYSRIPFISGHMYHSNKDYLMALYGHILDYDTGEFTELGKSMFDGIVILTCTTTEELKRRKSLRCGGDEVITAWDNKALTFNVRYANFYDQFFMDNKNVKHIETSNSTPKDTFRHIIEFLYYI